ncbi:nuclear transport factor 2 family protein [Flavisolibacter ginsenosidimutans]|uniref:Nuclear transport factor 2 family protein n=1 Tax=Flavisolibacter ginsenosidimutans TaxID=661481 RepID=A0A5B8UJC6_9BACT|nr:nuclear transport factor 2 family protein [Flavisolibacter ginsenosidimutans]QEC56105.1 nuclear transport factor 2 family protein [Flavisolibacter ginsenosidimutans]
MTTQEIVLTTQEVAARFNELAKEGRFDVIQEELFSPDVVSIEPTGGNLPNAEGIAAIKKKGEDFNAMIEEMHGGWCSEPVIGGNFFSVAMGMECTMKGSPERMKMDEVAVYEVKNGKIVKEQFFF